jgi:hypothetical protein
VSCRFNVSTGVVRRPGNVIAVEAGCFGSERCTRKLPSHWEAIGGSGASALRWLASGGSPLVFGHCTPNGNCPERGNRIAARAAELLYTEPPPPLPAADVGAVPQALNSCSDTCASYGCSGRWWKVPIPAKE